MSIMIVAQSAGMERNVVWRDELFLCEHGVEIAQIYAGIIASSLFRVDIPLSSQHVRFGTQMIRVEMDGEVELTKKF